MPDLEKVIKGLECCAVKNITPESARHCGICPYDRERNGEMDFDCQNDLLCAALELLKAKEPGWVSVKDRLPPMYRMVLITGKNSAGGSFGVIKGSHDGDKGQWYRDDIGQYVDSRGDTVTYWMPLPDPPKEG